MFVGCCEYIVEVIQFVFDVGDWVIFDCFIDVMFVYQGGGRGLVIDWLEVLECWVQQGLQLIKIILFDLVFEIVVVCLVDVCMLDKFEVEFVQFFLCICVEYLCCVVVELD